MATEQVVIFQANNADDLQTDVNAWIDEDMEVGDEVKDVKYNVQIDIIQTKAIRTFSALLQVGAESE